MRRLESTRIALEGMHELNVVVIAAGFAANSAEKLQYDRYQYNDVACWAYARLMGAEYEASYEAGSVESSQISEDDIDLSRGQVILSGLMHFIAKHPADSDTDHLDRVYAQSMVEEYRDSLASAAS